MEININDSVEVALTAFGAKIYNADRQYYLDKHDLGFVRKAEGDVLKGQLWYIMQLYGPHIHLGGEVPFVMCRMNILKGSS